MNEISQNAVDYALQFDWKKSLERFSEAFKKSLTN